MKKKTKIRYVKKIMIMTKHTSDFCKSKRARSDVALQFFIAIYSLIFHIKTQENSEATPHYALNQVALCKLSLFKPSKPRVKLFVSKF